MTTNVYTVYKITNLINGKIYIGKHVIHGLTDCYFGSGKWLQLAIKEYGIANFSREILLICKDRKQMNLAERILVVVDKETTYNLVPGSSSGWSGPHTELAKAKVSAANKGRIHTAQARINMGESHRGFKHSEESKHKMRKPKKGYVLSENGRARLLERNRTRIVSAETRAKMSDARRGYVFSEESKTKISESNRGKIRSEETRKRLSESHKGFRVSKETKDKISATIRAKRIFSN